MAAGSYGLDRRRRRGLCGTPSGTGQADPPHRGHSTRPGPVAAPQPLTRRPQSPSGAGQDRGGGPGQDGNQWMAATGASEGSRMMLDIRARVSLGITSRMRRTHRTPGPDRSGPLHCTERACMVISRANAIQACAIEAFAEYGPYSLNLICGFMLLRTSAALVIAVCQSIPPGARVFGEVIISSS